MIFNETSLADAFLIELEKRGDDRGFFARSFCSSEFANHGLESSFIQQNISRSAEIGTLRGMHYQIGQSAETKYIRCQKGSILDIIIDLRKDSVSYLQHEAFELNELNSMALYVPKGFAHGFITLEENTEVSYLVSSSYDSKNERGIRWNDQIFNINWPDIKIKLSDKDCAHPDFKVENSLDNFFNETSL